MRVIVTRPASQAAPLVDALRRAGYEPVLCPLIEIEPIDDGPIDVAGYEWVLVTSANGAEELVKRHRGYLPRIAAIGAATASALASYGVAVDFVPSEATQEALVAELDADFRAVYRTRRLCPDTPPRGDLAILASPSAADAFADLGLDIPVVTIGPQTTAAARGRGLLVRAQAENAQVDGLVAAVHRAAG